jgi:hypothetical protein
MMRMMAGWIALTPELAGDLSWAGRDGHKNRKTTHEHTSDRNMGCRTVGF